MPPSLAVTDAVDLADESRAADGFEALLAGLHRAQDLVRRWEDACDNYAERHGIGRA